MSNHSRSSSFSSEMSDSSTTWMSQSTGNLPRVWDDSPVDKTKLKRAKRMTIYGPKGAEVFKKIYKDSDSESYSEDFLQMEPPAVLPRDENSLRDSNGSSKDFSHTQQIRKLIGTFFSDWEGSKIDLLSGMLLVMTFHGYREELTGQEISYGDPAWVSGRYFMKFAAAAYGNMLACLKMKKKFFQYWWGDTARSTSNNTNSPTPKEKKAGITAIPPKGDKPVVFQHTGIAEEDFICGRWGAGIARGGSEFLPGYYLCVDHHSSNVVLAIRGSSNLNDALTDMVGHYEPYRDGAVHRGMLHMTYNLLDKIKNSILETLDKFSEYGFVVCGHSLGAGITSLFTLVFHDTYPDVKIHGYAYACPCTMDSVLSKYCENFLTTFVNGDDCVSRISLGSLDELKITMKHFLDSSGKSLGTRLFHVTKQLTGIQSSKLASLFRVSKERAQKTIEDYKTEDRLEHLYPPGKLYHIYRDENNELKGELSHYSKFGHIIISGTMFTDHMPHTYEKMLKRLSDPILEVGKRYHRRFLRVYGAKWCSRHPEMLVALNPLLGGKSPKEIYANANYDELKEIISGLTIKLKDNIHVRSFCTGELSESVVPQLIAPRNIHIPMEKKEDLDEIIYTEIIQLNEIEENISEILMGTDDSFDDDCSDEFFDCEEGDFDTLMEEIINRNIGNTNITDLLALQASLIEKEKFLLEKEKELNIREAELIAREKELEENGSKKKSKSKSKSKTKTRESKRKSSGVFKLLQ